MSDLGREQIKSVRIPWRVDQDGEWVGLEIGLASGGMVEGVLSISHPVEFEGAGAGQGSVLYAVRAVPADAAGKEPFFWPAPGEDSCQAYGYVPKQLAATEFPDARVAFVDVMIEEVKSERKPAANGRLVVADYCDLLSKVDPGSVPSLEVRLLDENGKKLWSGYPAGRNDEYPRELDVLSE